MNLATRFTLVGLVCAATHNVIVLAADRWAVHYAVSCVLSFIVVVVLGFLLHVRFTFQQQPSLDAFGRYAASMAANYPITLALLFAMCDLAHWPVMIAAPVATVAMMVWNFLASRWAIVRPPVEPALVPPQRPKMLSKTLPKRST
jgi:putative flippase GtrA